MFEILKLNKISGVVEKILGGNYTLSEAVANPDAVLVRSAPMADYVVGDKLVAVGRAGAGVNNIPVDKMSEKGVVVFNTPGANANAVKELVICGMLLAMRDVLGGIKWVNTLTTDVAKTAEKGKGAFGGFEIKGKTLGVVGLGAIGMLVANACVALGMDVIGYDPYLSKEASHKLDKSVKIVDLDEIYALSDIITLHVPLVPETKALINMNTLAKMKDGVIILNMARGELADTAAMKEALKSKKVAKYVVDFPDETVLNTDGIIVIPHLGASTEEAEEMSAEMASEQLKAYLEEGNIINSVNYPNLEKDRKHDVRTCVLFRAEDLEAVEKTHGDKKVATRGKFGYAIFDGKEAVEVPCAIRTRVI